MAPPLIAALAALIIAVAGTPLLRYLSHRHGVLDLPNERSSHVHPTPRTGGIAIGAGTVAAFFVAEMWRERSLVTILGCAALVAALGLVDDFRSLSARTKLAVQIVAAVALIYLARLTLWTFDLPFAGKLSIGVAGVLVSLIWLVGVTNAYNFMDGINGIAAAEGIICGWTFAYLLYRAGDETGAVLPLALAFALAGFFFFNASGSIFMGDVGSGFVGFLLAALGLRLAWFDVPFIAVMLPLLPFLLDTSATIVRRAKRRERLFSAHRTHYYQRLTDLGWTHLGVTALWSVMAVISAAGAVVYTLVSDPGRVAIVAALVVVHVIVGAMIDRGRPASGPIRETVGGAGQTPVPRETDGNH